MSTEFPRIPGFKLVEQCGRGGSSTVYLGIDRDGIRRAVRVLRPDDEHPELLEHEASAVAAYRNIAREQRHLIDIIYIGQTRDCLYYIMPLADSDRPLQCKYQPKTLAVKMRGGGYPDKDKLRDITDIIQGVAFLHGHGLAHRDLKPDNILFVDGVLKIADPGLASPLGQVASFGTPGFSPDFPLDGRDADIYAIGKIIYCIFSGFNPERYPEPPKSWNSGFYSRLNRIILKCCSRNETARYSSVAELSADVENLRRPSFAQRGWNSFRTVAPWMLLILPAGEALFLGGVPLVKRCMQYGELSAAEDELTMLRQNIQGDNVLATKRSLDKLHWSWKNLFESPENARFYVQVSDNAEWLRALSAENNDFAAAPIILNMCLYSDNEKADFLQSYLPTLSGETKIRMLFEYYLLMRHAGDSVQAEKILAQLRNMETGGLNQFSAATMFLNLSNQMTREKRYDEALEFANRAHELIPYLFSVYLMRFQAYYYKGDYRMAKFALDDLRNVSPGCVAAPKCYRMLIEKGIEF